MAISWVAAKVVLAVVVALMDLESVSGKIAAGDGCTGVSNSGDIVTDVGDRSRITIRRGSKSGFPSSWIRKRENPRTKRDAFGKDPGPIGQYWADSGSCGQGQG